MTLKIHSTEAERLAEYRICQERGHQGDQTIIHGPIGLYPWNICRFCGTHFWTETKQTFHESNKPEGAE